MHNQINELQTLITETANQVTEIEAKQAALTARRRDLDNTIATADKELGKPYSFPETKTAYDSRKRAMSDRSQIIAELDTLRVNLSTLQIRLQSLQQDQIRKAYESATIDEMTGRCTEIVDAIKAVDHAMIVLSDEVATLHHRRDFALIGSNAVRACLATLTEATEAHKKAQGEAYIAGTPVDLTALVSRMRKAQQALDTALTDASAGMAAAPLIAARLAAITGEQAALADKRSTLARQYFEQQSAINELEIRNLTAALLDAYFDRMALDTKVDGGSGYALFKAANFNLRVPVLGKSTEAVQMNTPELAAMIAKLDSTLTNQLEGNHHVIL